MELAQFGLMAWPRPFLTIFVLNWILILDAGYPHIIPPNLYNFHRYFSLISNRWLSIRLELIGSIVILFCSILAVFSRDWGTATAGLIGLAVSKSLDVRFLIHPNAKNAIPLP